MNLSVNSFSAGVSCLKSNKTPAFKGALDYRSNVERERRAIDARLIGAISSVNGGDSVRISFLDPEVRPKAYGMQHREMQDDVDVPYEKAIKAYAKALAENGVVKI